MINNAAHKDVSSDSVVSSAPGMVIGVVLTAAGETSTLILYDNASAASGTVLLKLSAVANTSIAFCPAIPYSASLGIYADIGGTGANATVVYV